MTRVVDLFCGGGGETTGIVQAAQGFPREYRFAGNKGDQVRQIGNAVPVNTARALALEALA
jgi:site-specific DNA-cytosine methylase